MRDARRALIVASILVLGLAACEREQKAVKEDLPAVRAAKARADAQVIAGAIRTYAATCGQLPESLEALTTLATMGGGPCGPFLRAIPEPPAGWSAYEYSKAADGSFAVTTAGGGQTVRAP